jgi:hypothetical protein
VTKGHTNDKYVFSRFDFKARISINSLVSSRLEKCVNSSSSIRCISHQVSCVAGIMRGYRHRVLLASYVVIGIVSCWHRALLASCVVAGIMCGYRC